MAKEKKYSSDIADALENMPNGVFKYASSEDDLYEKLYKDVYENPKPNKKIIESMQAIFEGVSGLDIKIEDNYTEALSILKELANLDRRYQSDEFNAIIWKADKLLEKGDHNG